MCEARFQSKDLRTLTAFFKVENEQGAMLRAIHRCDRDRFKPLVNFLKGITSNTDDLNIELLAWLIDFPNRPFKTEEYVNASSEIEHNVVPAKTEIEGNIEENLKADNADTSARMNEQELAKAQPVKGGITKRVQFTTRQKVISVLFGILLLALFSFYLVNNYTSADLSGKRSLTKNDLAGNHFDKDTSIVSPGRERFVGGNHKTGLDLTMKQSPLPQQSQEDKANMPKTSEKHEPDPVVNSLVSTAVDFVSFTNPESNADIAILIIDSNRKTITNVASAVANLYRNKSYSVSSGVFTYAFINSKYVDEVANGDISVLSKLALPSSLKYIVVGKYKYGIDNGQRTRFIYRARLDVTVISIQQKMQVDGFELTVANGYDDEEHARAGAIEKLIDQYQMKSRLIKLN